jgi:uncharacterized OB-fold protein
VTEDLPHADPTTQRFWRAAEGGVLLLQRCEACGHHQLYPRPFCLGCDDDRLGWVAAAGAGTVYSQTTVMLADPSYTVALVDLSEGPRVMVTVVGEGTSIGDAVSVGWQAREDEPPLLIASRT